MKKYKYMLIAPCISTIIILVIYLTKGVYPFGSKTIAHADLAQIYVTNFTYFINSIRSGDLSSLIFTNLIYSGNVVFSLIGITGCFSVFSLLYFLCFNVQNLVSFMSYILIIKVALSAITLYYSFDKIFSKTDTKLNIVFSFIYSMSAYTLTNYTTITWLDFVILFPLLCLGLKNIFDNKNIILYTVVLSIMIIANFQIAFMVLFFVLIISTICMKFYIKENRKECILKLGIATISSILISAVVLLPVLKLYFESDRISFSSDIIYIDNLLTTKLSYIILSSILVFAVIKGIRHVFKDNILKIGYITFAFVGLLPILLEGINRIWHGGSYDSFCFRYGFIPIFVMLAISYYYFMNYYKKNNITKNNKKNIVLLGFMIFYSIIPIILDVYVSVILNESNPAFKFPVKAIVVLLISVVCKFVIYNLLSKYNNKWTNYFIASLIVIETGIFSYGFIAIQPKNTISFSHSDYTINTGNTILKEMKENLDLESGYKYKQNETILLENAGLQTGIPFNSSWVLSTFEQMQLHSNLGYFLADMKMRSMGGTPLSDALMNVKYVFSKKELNSELYELIDKTNNNIYLYKYKNEFPMGFVVDVEDTLNELSNTKVLENQNIIYHTLSKDSENIIDILDNNDTVLNNVILKDGVFSQIEEEKESYIEYEVDITDKRVLYCYNSKDTSENLDYIEVIKGESTNTFDLTKVGITEIGYLDNEKVKIRVHIVNNIKTELIQLGLFNINKYNELSSLLPNVEYIKGSKTFKIQGKDGQKLLLSFPYDKNLKVFLNGKSANISNIFGEMVLVDLEDGENVVSYKYTNPYILIGAIISVCGIGIIVLFTKIKCLFKSKALQYFALVVFVIVMIGFIAIVYIGGTIWSIILIKGAIK